MLLRLWDVSRQGPPRFERALYSPKPSYTSGEWRILPGQGAAIVLQMGPTPDFKRQFAAFRIYSTADQPPTAEALRHLHAELHTL